MAWVETMCRPTLVPLACPPILTDPTHQRIEAHSLLTYPEWHIVHTCQDYAAVITSRDSQDFSGRMAADFASFLQQVPWYRRRFADDAAALVEAATPVLRDRERAFALGLEFRAKAACAGLVVRAVAATAVDDPTIRSIVTGFPAALSTIDGGTVIVEHPKGVEIETPRHRAFIVILQGIAGAGGHPCRNRRKRRYHGHRAVRRTLGTG